MAPHSSILAWRIPWTEEPDGLQSMELQRVGHDCATFTSLTYDTTILPDASGYSSKWPATMGLVQSLFMEGSR